MTRHGALMFAVFSSHERAREAQAILTEGREGSEVELIASPDEVRRRARSPTGIRGLGMLLGISLIVGFIVAGFGSLVLAAAGTLPEPVPVALLGGALAVVIAAMLGGLAGWLAFSSHTRLELRRLCSLLERGHALLLFPAHSDVRARLRERGAVQIGSLT
jgi:hypothetical protein